MRKLYLTTTLLSTALMVCSCVSHDDGSRYDDFTLAVADAEAQPAAAIDDFSFSGRGVAADTYSEPKESEESASPYSDNRLSTGEIPYDNQKRIRGDDSRIEVTTHRNSVIDVVVILKQNGKIVKNVYIQGGRETASIDVPNGYYYVYFYSGKGWNPYKAMGGGMIGGFVADEDFQEDPANPVWLFNNILSYELIRQVNGNFSTRESSKGEIFQ